MASITAHDALIHIMVTMSAVDRAMTDSELGKIGTRVKTLPVFRTVIPRDVKAEEAPSRSQCLLSYSPSSRAGKAYCELSGEILHSA